MTLTRVILETEEAWRSRPYYCDQGYPTIGWGFRIGKKGAALPEFFLPRVVGDAWLDYLIEDIRQALGVRLSGLTTARQAVIVSMAYQLGINGCLNFRRMWIALGKRDYTTAAEEMLDSVWAREQTPARAHRHATIMQIGSHHGVYPS